MVSLSKNQTISLSKQSSAISNLHFGLGWDPIKKKGLLGGLFGGNSSIDLDAGCVLLDKAGNEIDTVWFRKLKSSCGSVVHSGDNLTGEGDGDDEVIRVDLNRLPQNVEYLAFTVNSFRGQTFNEVENAFCRVVDQANKEQARYQLTEQGSHTGIVISSLRRNNGQWDFTAHGQSCRGRTISDMHADIVTTVVR
ncbi:TerD family protein [Pectobacterium polaris]|uniref:Tellurium resistance protein TerZ n=1 Tax=Pectobacterium polaris TaxID=2042057 RepID=A0AAW5GAR5_9GAMM|nr:TerD family protein [Pectobacterium polaris]MCL6351251.1 tellurium resistance protein TerZ [Pectobacterium polaris]MCL6368721.1 tellurium resistance protein TerZ [Pectobacterium polaris]MDG0801690.1 tellurium resistance TerZ family protein [Pectobacterium polaris]RJL26860.1 tellurium resistance protein TerZ [Pectobacterium polaris]RUS01176.1 tellurium resistance protein TerZ [Pectobacterium polaris]